MHLISAQLRKVERDKKTMDQEIVELTNKLLDAKNTIDKLEELNVGVSQPSIVSLFSHSVACKKGKKKDNDCGTFIQPISQMAADKITRCSRFVREAPKWHV